MKNENSEINELFNKAIQNHKNNKLNEAFKLYQNILNKNSTQNDLDDLAIVPPNNRQLPE